GSRAATLDEELDAVAFDEELPHIGVDEGRVEPLPAEAPADEKRAAAPQDRTERKEAEVLAGGDERWDERMAVEDGAQDEVVDVALVARKVDDGAFARGLSDLFAPVFIDLDAVVDAVP